MCDNIKWRLGVTRQIMPKWRNLVDALDSESSGHSARGGSNPPFGTKGDTGYSGKLGTLEIMDTLS